MSNRYWTNKDKDYLFKHLDKGVNWLSRHLKRSVEAVKKMSYLLRQDKPIIHKRSARGRTPFTLPNDVKAQAQVKFMQDNMW